jgi:phenylpropionate dioxygenase-like ring-hydroxylating dioxygenase large terminal subunit
VTTASLVRIGRAPERRFPFSSCPEGWFRVAWSRALSPGKVLPLRWFGLDLVLFRGTSGRAYLLDAHCPHLGAHLGRGGSVVEDSHRVAQSYSAFPMLEWIGRRVTGTVETTLTGLGRIAIHATVEAGPTLEYLVVSYPTPVDDECVEIHVAVSMRKLDSRIATEVLLAKATHEAAKTIDQDIPIFENKLDRERPLLITGEKAIAEYRHWARRFYPNDGDRSVVVG